MRFKVVTITGIALAWFLFAGYFLSSHRGVADWLPALFLYLLGLYWVIPYILKTTMYTLNTASALPYGDKRYGWLRHLLFILGLLICYFTSTG